MSEPLVFDAMNPKQKGLWARRLLRVVWILTDTADLTTTKLDWLREWRWGEHQLEFLDPLVGGEARPIPRLWSRTTILDTHMDEWEQLTRAALQALEEAEPGSTQIDAPTAATSATTRQFYLAHITPEQLAQIADAAIALVEGVRMHVPSTTECSGVAMLKLNGLGLELERALNPDKLAFRDPQRIAIYPLNWSHISGVRSDLRDVRSHFDNVMVTCSWQDFSDGPSPMRRWQPIPIHGLVDWPRQPISDIDLVKIEQAARRLRMSSIEASASATTDNRLPAEQNLVNATHSADFTFVKWFGTEYTFALGIQSSAIAALWAEWERSGLGLHQDTIRNTIDAERDSFRMDTAFRNHSAFGTMIERCGDGKYKLGPPKPATTAPDPRVKKSVKRPSNSRRKRI